MNIHKIYIVVIDGTLISIIMTGWYMTEETWDEKINIIYKLSCINFFSVNNTVDENQDFYDQGSK